MRESNKSGFGLAGAAISGRRCPPPSTKQNLTLVNGRLQPRTAGVLRHNVALRRPAGMSGRITTEIVAASDFEQPFYYAEAAGLLLALVSGQVGSLFLQLGGLPPAVLGQAWS